MTDHAELIARAEASLDGVTDGPWVVTYERGNTHLRMGERRDSQMCDETYYPWTPENLNDWEFIAASRQNVPDLIAALKASEARVAELEAALTNGVDLIKGEKVGREWKTGCNGFVRKALAALKGGDA